MPYLDLHDMPFDSGTIAKLEIFEDYAEAWLPTFIMQGIPEIHIFDFFAGPGYDCASVPGTPIRLLEKVNRHLGNIFQNRTKITIHLNEFEPSKKQQNKFETLRRNCAEYLDEHSKMKHFLSIEYYNKNAEILFFELLPLIKNFPSLVYLDQNGIKFVSNEYVSELEKLKTTDFIYFVSSSYFKRLGGTQEFQRVLPFTTEELVNEKQENMHRVVANKIKSILPVNTDLKLFPFSIKKGANIYGIIFGAKHYRAVDKFLGVAWKRNEVNGEADFDIDYDTMKSGYDLFGRIGVTKIEKFQADLERLLMTEKISNNKEALVYTYQCGHVPQHTKDVIKKLRKKGLTYIGKTAGINYENVFKKIKIVHYKIIPHGTI